MHRRDQRHGGPAAGAGGEGGPPEVPGSPVAQGEEGLPKWVYPIPDEEVLFGPDARHVRLYSDWDTGHFFIHLGDSVYFLKPSGIVGGQVVAETLINDLGRAAGIRDWPLLRVFPDPQGFADQVVLVLNHIPGKTLEDLAKMEGSITEVLRRLDPRSVADTLVLELTILAGDRHDANYMVTPARESKRGCLVGIDYAGAFDPGCQLRFGAVAENLPEELLATLLRREMLSAILAQKEEVLRRLMEEMAPNLDSSTTLMEVTVAVESRYAVLELLLLMVKPTLGDLIALHPDRPEAGENGSEPEEYDESESEKD